MFRRFPLRFCDLGEYRSAPRETGDVRQGWVDDRLAVGFQRVFPSIFFFRSERMPLRTNDREPNRFFVEQVWDSCRVPLLFNFCVYLYLLGVRSACMSYFRSGFGEHGGSTPI